MKKIKYNIVLAVSLLAIFSSCSKSDNTVANNSTTSSIIIQGNWRVTYFKNGTDSTGSYNGFKLLFNAGGTVSAYNDLLSVNGTWSSHNDDSTDKLLLNFSTSLTMIAALSNDWHITAKSAVKIVMEDVSGGAGGTEYLTIEKN